jgi:Putative archaeal flagellar protein D/E
MSLDPRRYDVRELRRLAGTGGGAETASRERRRRPDGNRAERAARSAAFRELVQRQRGLGEAGGERPYLRTIPAGADAEREIADWLGYLVDAGGHLRSRDALSYYADIGWITPAVAAALKRRLPGFAAPRNDRPFTAADHRISLVSVVRIVSCTTEDQ